MQPDVGKPRGSKSAARKAKKPRASAKRRRPASVQGPSWLVLALDDIGEVWTSARALGMPVAPFAAFLQKKYRLNTAKARPAAAFNAISRLLLPDNVIIHEEGHS